MTGYTNDQTGVQADVRAEEEKEKQKIKKRLHMVRGLARRAGVGNF